MSRSIRYRLPALMIPAAVLPARAFADTAAPRYSGWWLPEAATSTAGRIDDVFLAILAVTTFVFLLVLVLLVIAMVRFRARGERRAKYSTGSYRIELLWAAVPAAILTAIALYSTSIWSQIKQEFPSEEDAFVVEVRPRQFQWDIVYPGADRRFGTADDSTAINVLDVPAGRPVIVRLVAQDVIHSFFVPEFRIKQDAVPGMVTRLWFQVDRPGTYEIACAELCGLGHYRMRGILRVRREG